MPEVDDWVTPGMQSTADDWITPAGETQPQVQTPHKFGLGDTWPARLGKFILHAAALPREVWEGKVDPLSQEGIERSMDIATIFNPAEPGIAAGRGFMGAPITRAPFETPANIAAAETAADVGGKGLPAGIASPNPIVRATTQAVKQFPLVGPKITQGVNEAIEGVGKGVKNVAEDLRGGDIESRADLGAEIRPTLKGVIEDNKVAMNAEYNGVRSMIDPTKEFELPATDATLKRILERRRRMPNPMEGLHEVAGLVERPPAPEMGPTVLRGVEGLEDTAVKPWGANFEDLHRVRSNFGSKTKFGEPHPGYNEGERKELHGAMTQDLNNILRQQGGEQAVNAFSQARTNASKYIEQNRILNQLSNKRDEGLASTLMRASKKDTGDAKLLQQLKQSMPPEQWDKVSGQMMSELGHNLDGEFSLSKFGENWNKVSPEAKDLFDPNHRRMLDRVAGFSKFLKGGEQYKAHGNLAHAGATMAIIEHVGEALTEAAAGDIKPLAKTVGGLTAGYIFGRALARPASASAVAGWARTAQLYSHAPTLRNRVAVNLATRNLVNNLVSLGIGTRDQIIKALMPKAAEPDGNQPPTKRRPIRIDIPAQPNR
jgi:hypothetical protein